MSSYTQRFPVRPLTFRGKVIVGMLRLLYFILHLFSGPWRKAPRAYDEDPKRMRFLDSAFLGYKYYFLNNVEVDEKDRRFFSSQRMDFSPPSDFVSEHRLSLHAGGDLMAYKRFRPETCRHLWSEVGADFFGGDLVLANLETPLDLCRSKKSVPEVMLSNMYFNGSESLFSIFSGHLEGFRGYDVLSVANNHSLDMGVEGLEETLGFLERRGVCASGGSLSEEGSRRIPAIERNGIRIAFISYTFSLNLKSCPAGEPWRVNHLPMNRSEVDLSRLVEDCRLARAQGADFVVFTPHAGWAYQLLPHPHTRDLYHRVLEHCGVDVILATHPHVAQPTEAYTYTDKNGCRKKGFIAYSLGDFVADDIFWQSRLSMFIELTIEKGRCGDEPCCLLTEVRVHPLYLSTLNGKNKTDFRFHHYKKLLDRIENEGYPSEISVHLSAEIHALQPFLPVLIPQS